MQKEECRKEFDVAYPLTEAQIQMYHEQGFIKLKNVFAPRCWITTERRSPTR